MLSATAPLISAEAMLPKTSAISLAQESQPAPTFSTAGQLEAEARYQHILSLYGSRLDDSQKAELKRLSSELQPMLERIRSFQLQNGDTPALYLKPLVEREKKPQPAPKPAAKKS
jgi:hypothetical protein